MGRPPKKGLDYYPKDINYYDDFKIMDLINAYGPVGQTIYDIILGIVYREGYYLELPLEKLAMMVMRIIGNRWVKSKDFVLQVIYYCADIGLFSRDLLLQDIVTSAGIQRRYAAVTARNKVDKRKYWLLLEEIGQASFPTPKNSSICAESRVSVTETPVSDARSAQRKEKERKENKRKGEGKQGEKTRASLLPFGKFENVFLTAKEYQELGEVYQSRAKLIDRLSLYKESSGKTYENDFATLLKWAEKDGDARRPKKTQQEPSTPVERAPMPEDMKKLYGCVFKTLE